MEDQVTLPEREREREHLLDTDVKWFRTLLSGARLRVPARASAQRYHRARFIADVLQVGAARAQHFVPHVKRWWGVIQPDYHLLLQMWILKDRLFTNIIN